MNLQLLNQLVSCPSVFPMEGKVGNFLVNCLHELGLQVSTQKVSHNRFNIFASRGKDPRILFYGHLDTVNSGTFPGWKSEPYSLKLVGNRLYGLGAYDMKGGIYAFLEAVKNTSSPVKILLAVDEENISAGAWSAVKHRSHFFKQLDLIISSEPNFGLGENSLTLGRTGRLVFGLNFHGKSAHLARQTAGQDAIFMAGKFITRFYQQKNRLFLSPYTRSQVRKINAESVGMSVCDRVTLEIEVLPGSEDTEAGITKLLTKLSGTPVFLLPRATPYLAGYKFNYLPYESEISDIIQKRLHNPLQKIFRSSVADDNVLATMGIPVVTWGPSGGGAHEANEYVLAGSLEKFILMYSDLLKVLK